MSIILSVQSYRGAALAAPLAASFDPLGGSIGRAPGNGLTLEDPGKYISRNHARIEFHHGAYCLTDTGSNPSLVNDRPLGNGQQVALHDGDMLVIGDYAIEVRLAAEAGAAAPLPRSPLQDAMRAPAATAAAAPPDALAAASILDCGPSFAGASLLDDWLSPPASADAAPAFRGAESDHVPPQQQAWSRVSPATALAAGQGAAPTIPDDYDPLADFLPPRLGAAAPAAPTQVAAAAPAPARTQAAPTPTATATTADDGAVLAALLRGLGLQQLPPERSPAELAELVGAMLRAATGGAIEVLMARAMTKRESRLEVTMIASQSNNPLKFCPDADSALSQMLGKPRPAYMPPVAAYSAAFDDMKAHELALLAGMSAALIGVLKRFDPAAIEAGLPLPSVMDKMLLATRKAKLWDRLVAAHRATASQADDDFQRLFGEQFGRAYDQQIARLRASRK